MSDDVVPAKPSSETITRLCRESCDKSMSSVGRISLQANSLSVRYAGSPVFLVGGALTDPDPRDIDIVIIMPDALFIAAYEGGDGIPVEQDPIGAWDLGGMSDDPPRIWRRWARDCAKQAADLTRRIGHPIVDFKTQPESWAKRYVGKPRRQLSVDIVVSSTPAPLTAARQEDLHESPQAEASEEAASGLPLLQAP